ncbi:hypothetical protein [Alicyclobacillus ferrooxydans]|uniref:Uncharacterized protein n=1 Tax=Alicyclobacillus ferrooxydans TaxID=471514 RepID=A0A0P9EMK6_9BACL|nr:hypothetical protein [Alicyclobacillus ferrooxydans]KPV44622.1 hypothetical protein AN477_06460 [Alicyclobacillus ferrooxydans]
MLFRVGKVHISRAILTSNITAQDMVSAFALYINGDWGETTAREEVENDLAIACGDRIVGRYFSDTGEEFCISTYEGVTEIVTTSEVKNYTRAK